MLITQIEELTAVYPTSRWDNMADILPLFYRVERTKLSKYLGLPLLTRLNSEYKILAVQPGGLSYFYDNFIPDASNNNYDNTGETIDADKENDVHPMPSQLTLDILRTCQEVIVFIALSNNVRLLSSSLNQGGGFNSMSTNDYEPSSDTQLKALSLELWRNGMDSLDSLLILLEEDAKADKVYTELWQKSLYYYRHSDLIFRTADELSHYLTIDGGRAAYIQLTPGLRNMQSQYITPRIGQVLVDMIISDKCPEESPILPYFKSLSTYVRQALANYTSIEMLRLKASADKNSTQSRARSEMESDYHNQGDNKIALALEIIVEHPQEFKEYIDGNSSLQFEYLRATKVAWVDYLKSLQPDIAPPSDNPDKDSDHWHHDSKRKDPLRPRYDAICDLGGLHLT